jgi:hypothetical protein
VFSYALQAPAVVQLVGADGKSGEFVLGVQSGWTLAIAMHGHLKSCVIQNAIHPFCSAACGLSTNKVINSELSLLLDSWDDLVREHLGLGYLGEHRWYHTFQDRAAWRR